MKNKMMMIAVFGILAGMLFGPPLSTLGGCAHPGQSTLRAGQCLLDNGVLAEVLTALGKPDYLKQIENVGLTRAGDLIDCALQAAATRPAPAAGSGSAGLSALVAIEADTIVNRAREVLASRRAAGK